MMPLFESARLVWIVIGTTAAVVSLPGTLELLLVTIGNLLPERPTKATPAAGQFRLAVVVPAHNEQASVAASVRSLLCAPHPFAEAAVVVVADNCTDTTAEIAGDAGARVIVRTDAARRGKGYALDYAFRILAAEHYDALLVVDADTEVDPNFLEEAGGALHAGAAAIQVRYLVRNPAGSLRTRLMKIALLAFNVARPRGRDHLKLSCGLLGNGFGMRRETLLAVPYSAASVVEDLEYHLMLVNAGRRVHFVNRTAVYGEMPEGGEGVASQRVRWEGGRFRMLREHSLPLALKLLRGDASAVEPLLELLLLPLAFHASLLLIACSTPWMPARLFALLGVLIGCLHLLEALLLGGNLRDVGSLALAPFYVLWKLLLIPALFRSSRSNVEWTRTERVAERQHR
jgi:cellulose synthase/poly-beta-1,6-N-acetylglucosamine synthase-like glycosyltransferase